MQNCIKKLSIFLLDSVHIKIKQFLCKHNKRVELSLYYGRRSVDQFFLISGLPLGPLTRFYLYLFSSDNYFILLSMASSLTRKRVCSLQCNHSLVRPLTTNNHTLLFHPRLCSLSVASYDSQGLRWRYSNPPPHGDVPAITKETISTQINIGGNFTHVVDFWKTSIAMQWLAYHISMAKHEHKNGKKPRFLFDPPQPYKYSVLHYGRVSTN
jgi:hypothetical protein